jgi:hypothetical protein
MGTSLPRSSPRENGMQDVPHFSSTEISRGLSSAGQSYSQEDLDRVDIAQGRVRGKLWGAFGGSCTRDPVHALLSDQ